MDDFKDIFMNGFDDNIKPFKTIWPDKIPMAGGFNKDEPFIPIIIGAPRIPKSNLGLTAIMGHIDHIDVGRELTIEKIAMRLAETTKMEIAALSTSIRMDELFSKNKRIVDSIPAPHNQIPLNKLIPTQVPKKQGRNHRCACGSGKKYKYCHMK